MKKLLSMLFIVVLSFSCLSGCGVSSQSVMDMVTGAEIIGAQAINKLSILNGSRLVSSEMDDNYTSLVMAYENGDTLNFSTRILGESVLNCSIIYISAEGVSADYITSMIDTVINADYIDSAIPDKNKGDIDEAIHSNSSTEFTIVYDGMNVDIKFSQGGNCSTIFIDADL